AGSNGFSDSFLDDFIRRLQSIGSGFAKVVVEAAREPIEKPARHQSPGKSEFFRLWLSASE
ncbi:MAG: hypothetical protein MI924_33775, partial [Chloroflexales bacterium]|nr:hypothetical protein [Chloroflexales bacterium]